METRSEEEVKKKCCVGLCPNLKLSKKAVAIEQPLKEKEFDPISFGPPLQQIVDPFVNSGEALPSRVMILNQVMDALKGPFLNMIGVYGMGGIGKTTLAKEVYRKAVEEELFDFVVMVTVSQTPDLRRIQGEIADFLGLKFDAEEVPGRASQLYKRLKNSKVLIILDDIWAKLELRSVGIPFDDEGKGCKILLTSRSVNILRRQMGTQKDFLLEVLREEEAWNLFEMTISDAKDPQVRAIATEIAKKCAGLPLLILMVATYLRNKESYVWHNMLNQLSVSSHEEIYEEVLRSSYQNLPGKEVQSFFLLCALCGNSNIWIECLVKYSMGLGMLKDIYTIEEARNRVFRLISKLKDESLLLDGDKKGCVKMHDVVRETALSIAYEVQNAFVGRSGVKLSEWPSKDCTRISLPLCDIDCFAQGLECPEAELFLLFTEDCCLEVPDLFFEGIRKLKVVDLTGIRFARQLPSSLGFLTILQTLCLEGCQLDDIAIIGELKQLKCLSFARSNIVELPREIEQLRQLKLLDLSKCSQLKVIPANVLSKLFLLEELYMGDSFVGWDEKGKASVMELDELCHLTTLEIQVNDAKKIPNRLFSKELLRYTILIGDEWDCYETYEASKTVKLRLQAIDQMKHGLKKLLRGTEALYLSEVRGIDENGLYNLDGEVCQQLKHLHIGNDDVIQYIINSTMWASCYAFLMLETLSLLNLNSLEEISHGELATGSFSKLRTLNISGCNTLRNLFSYSIAKCLSQLQEMTVKECDNMEAIICEGSEDNYSNDVIEFTQLSSMELWNLPRFRSIFSKKVSFPKLTRLDVLECESLKYICKTSTVKSLLQLKRLKIYKCEHMEEIILTEEIEEEEEGIHKIIFPNLDFLCLDTVSRLIRFSNGYPVEFQSLRQMYISKCLALKNLVGGSSDNQSLFNEMVTFSNLQIMDFSEMENLEYIWHSQLTSDSFYKLKSLTISSCWNLLAVFSSNVVRRFQRLEHLDIRNCPKIEEIYQLGELNSIEVVAFELRHLYIRSMASLKRIWSSEDGDGIFSFQNLKSVETSFCDKLEYVFPESIACDLLQLEKLYIWYCEVEHIVGKPKSVEAYDEDEAPPYFHFPELTFLRLENLRELRSFYSKTHIFDWPKLKYLRVHRCDKATKLGVKVNSNLKTLMLDCKISVEFSNEGISRLKVIELSHLKDNFPFGFLKRLYSLEKFVLTFSSLECIESILFDDETSVAEEENITTILPLKYLKIECCDRLKYIAPSSVSFQNLTTLHISLCGNLENLVTTSTAKTMIHLIELRITYCERMKEIVTNDGEDTEHKIIFNHLKCLELQYLPTLCSFCSGNYIFRFPFLEHVIVEQCLQMKIFCGGVLKTPKLRGVQDWKYPKYGSSREYEEAQYWEGNLNATIKSQYFRERALQNAYRWCVIEDPSSSKAILGNQLQFLNKLRYFYVRDCDSIQVVFDLEDVYVERWPAGLLPELEELQLINLPKLSEIWNKDHVRMFDFKMLRLLKVQNCSNLKYAFTQSMISALSEFQVIEVKNCKMMEAIIKGEEVEETELPNMRLPLLKKITIKGCPSIKEFMSPTLSREQNPRLDKEENEIAMPMLEELRIDWDIIKHKLKGNNQPDFFSGLKFIELVFPSNSFPTMEKFVLSDSSVEEIIIHGLDHYELLPRLRKIILSKLPNLKRVVYDNDPRRVSVFQNLQVLQVWECSRLETLAPSFVYFQNLTFLQVSTCNGLINLITASTAKSLVQLKTMYVGRCKKLRQIVAIESDGEEDEIGFHRLEYLVLDDLPCLTSFCSSKSTFDFPCLEEVFVIKCPKLKTFARSINTPKLSQVQTGGKEYEWEWEVSLNSTIQALSMKMS